MVSCKRLLQLAAIGAKRELEIALCDLRVLYIKSECEPVDCADYDNARVSVNKVSGEYADLIKLIKALESF